MSESQAPQFQCVGCNKTYRWKPELAGKKAKCKCGQVMEVPAEPPMPPEEEGLYDLVDEPQPRPQVQGSVMAPSPASNQPSPVAPAATMSATPASGRIGSPVLPYASVARPRPVDEDSVGEERGKHFYLPIALIVVGTALALFVNMRFYEISLAGATLVVGIKLLIDLVLIFLGCLIAIKLMDISLGSPGEALLKICAIAIAPGALGGLIELWVGPAAGMLVGFLMLGIYFILFKVFFDLDGSEMMILTVIIWLIRTWVGYFLAGVLLLGLMTALGASSSGGSGGSGTGNPSNAPALSPADSSQNADVDEE
ncbi:MAG: hypothetical protein IT447_00265 [Phycisphaerales bacterium]|nr:hypothetical protein [Phycisphaerales bacterium]